MRKVRHLRDIEFFPRPKLVFFNESFSCPVKVLKRLFRWFEFIEVKQYPIMLLDIKIYNHVHVTPCNVVNFVLFFLCLDKLRWQHLCYVPFYAWFPAQSYSPSRKNNCYELCLSAGGWYTSKCLIKRLLLYV